MKTMPNPSLLAFVLLAATSPCFALQSNMEVSKAKAQEMGVTIRTNLNGQSGVMVWLEFKLQGALKNFTRVELEITAGDKRLVDAPLQTTRPTPDSVSAYFSADPAYLTNSVLTIVVQESLRTRSGYLLKVKDFIESEKRAGSVMPVYGTAEQLKAMLPVKATLEMREPCCSTFRTANGKQFVIGSPGSGPEVMEFLGTLKENQTYDLPRAFLDYHKKK